MVIPIHLYIFYFELNTYLLLVEGDPGAISNPDGYQDALSKKQRRPQDEERRRKEQGPSVRTHKLGSVAPDLLKTQSVAFAYKVSHRLASQVQVKNRNIASKIPPRFAKKQGSMSLEQPEETLSANNLGTEIWETNSSGFTDRFSFTSCHFFLFCLEYLCVS